MRRLGCGIIRSSPGGNGGDKPIGKGAPVRGKLPGWLKLVDGENLVIPEAWRKPPLCGSGTLRSVATVYKGGASAPSL